MGKRWGVTLRGPRGSLGWWTSQLSEIAWDQAGATDRALVAVSGCGPPGRSRGDQPFAQGIQRRLVPMSHV